VKKTGRLLRIFTLSPCHLVTLSLLLGAAPASLPTTQPIARKTLDQIYRRELGNLYNPVDAEKCTA